MCLLYYAVTTKIYSAQFILRNYRMSIHVEKRTAIIMIIHLVFNKITNCTSTILTIWSLSRFIEHKINHDQIYANWIFIMTNYASGVIFVCTQSCQCITNGRYVCRYDCSVRLVIITFISWSSWRWRNPQLLPNQLQKSWCLLFLIICTDLFLYIFFSMCSLCTRVLDLCVSAWLVYDYQR